MKAVILIASVLLLVGCHHDPKPRECPTFDAKLSIEVVEYEDRAMITWDDVSNIETFLERKKMFNEGINELNKE